MIKKNGGIFGRNPTFNDVVVEGTLEVVGDQTFPGDVTVEGNLTVQGTTTTVDSVNLTVDDKQIEMGAVTGKTGLTATLSLGTAIVELATTSGLIPKMTVTKTGGTGAFGVGAYILSVDSKTQITMSVNHATAGLIVFDTGGASDDTADGGGIALKGTTDKLLSWIKARLAWVFSEPIETGNIRLDTNTISATNTNGSLAINSAGSGNVSVNSTTIPKSATLVKTTDLGSAAYESTTAFAPASKGVTNGDSHNHDGGDGAQIAYSSLSGLPTLGSAAAASTSDFAPAAKGVTNGDSHDHNGGDGAQIAYSSLSGLPTLGSAAAASTSDFAPAAKGVTNGDSHDHNGGDGAQIAYSSLSGLPTLGSAAAASTSDFAPAAKGVTNGDSHDHNGGDGAQIAYSSLSGLPTLGTIASQAANNVAITGGSISGADVTVGTGKTLDVSGGTLTLANDQISGDKIQGGTIGSITIGTLTVTGQMESTGGDVRSTKNGSDTFAGGAFFALRNADGSRQWLSQLSAANIWDLWYYNGTSGSKMISVDASGNIIMKQANAGIDFSVNANAGGATSEILNDYETGTFTATLTGSTTAPTTAVNCTGHYTKVGNKVTVTMWFGAVDTTGGSGSMLVTGLPFTSTSGSDHRTVSCPLQYGLSVPNLYNGVFMDGGSTTLEFYSVTNNGGWSGVTLTAGSGKYLGITHTYHTAS